MRGDHNTDGKQAGTRVYPCAGILLECWVLRSLGETECSAGGARNADDPVPSGETTECAKTDAFASL